MLISVKSGPILYHTRIKFKESHLEIAESIKNSQNILIAVNPAGILYHTKKFVNKEIWW